VSKIRNTSLLLLAIFVLSGCVGGSTPEEKIYNVLEETVKKEEQFEEVQKPLKELEEKEQKLFKEIMNLGMKEIDKIVKLSDEALANVKERKQKIEKEQEAMDGAEEEFNKAEDYVKKLKDEKLKKEAQTLIEKMSSRYKTHEKLTSAYLEALTLDKELYEMLKKEDLKMENLDEKISSINKKYKEVISVNEKYNSQTEEFNKLKKHFYKNAKVEIEE
jgi:chromosome segregation ATPase